MEELLQEIRRLITLIEKERELPNVLISLTPDLIAQLQAGEDIWRAVGLPGGRIQGFAIVNRDETLVQSGPFWVRPPIVDTARRAFLGDETSKDS